MLSHVTLGTNDFPSAVAFYDRITGVLGLTRIGFYPEGAVGCARGPDATPQLWIMRPFDGQTASPGNGAMIAFEAPDRATVDRFHAEVLAGGGTDGGAPGLRPHYHPDYYGAYARDSEGNKLCCVCHRHE